MINNRIDSTRLIYRKEYFKLFVSWDMGAWMRRRKVVGWLVGWMCVVFSF
jgi:hypothetical protein